MNRFFVSYKRHNKTTDGWAYKFEFSSENYNECLKKFHAMCGDDIASATFDFLCVELSDVNGNVLKKEVWTSIVPEPIPPVEA